MTIMLRMRKSIESAVASVLARFLQTEQSPSRRMAPVKETWAQKKRQLTKHKLLHRRQHVKAKRNLILVPLELKPADNRPVVQEQQYQGCERGH